ncbi:aminopeptidase [Streptococcus pneumoniae]|nr:aminopeptidase [Streptococcus pneumoniae]
MNAIQESFTDKLFANYEANVKYQAIENAASHNGIFAALERRQSHVDNTPVFSLDLTKDKVTNQKASGRCWMFAALNTFRHKLISQYKLENFELSQAHTFFWDKYEKSNWFLEQVIATSDQELLAARLASYFKHLNKMVVNGIWSFPSLKNTVSCLSQFILSLFHLAAVVS